MSDLQQIIDGLGCFTTKQHLCQTCAFNPNPGMSWPLRHVSQDGRIPPEKAEGGESP